MYGATRDYIQSVYFVKPEEEIDDQDNMDILEAITAHVGEDFSWQLNKPSSAEKIEVDLVLAADFIRFD